jgi:hypothetical protein
MSMREGEVFVQIDGKSYSGSFIVDRGNMTVSAEVGSKTSPVGEMALAVRARLMLRDMVLRARKPAIQRGPHPREIITAEPPPLWAAARRPQQDWFWLVVGKHPSPSCWRD